MLDQRIQRCKTLASVADKMALQKQLAVRKAPNLFSASRFVLVCQFSVQKLLVNSCITCEPGEYCSLFIPENSTLRL